MPNPSRKWDRIPIYGMWRTIDEQPIPGRIIFEMSSRVTRVDGRVIYADGARIERTIGDIAQQDTAIRASVRAAWRAHDEALDGPDFDGLLWDTWWDDVVVPSAIFTSFPASDDPDIVQQGFSVEVSEALTSGRGKPYSITPLLAQLGLEVPGINLNLVEVPPGSPNVPAPMYAKGVPGGVAALSAAGEVLDASGAPVGTPSEQQVSAAVEAYMEDHPSVPQALAGQAGRFRGIYDAEPASLPDPQVGDWIIVTDPT